MVGSEAGQYRTDGRLPVMKEVRGLAEARGMELVKPTSAASRLLRSAGRKEVNAIFHVTC